MPAEFIEAFVGRAGRINGMKSGCIAVEKERRRDGGRWTFRGRAPPDAASGARKGSRIGSQPRLLESARFPPASGRGVVRINTERAAGLSAGQARAAKRPRR